MTDVRDTFFIILVTFWTFLIIFSNIFEDYIDKPLSTASFGKEDMTIWHDEEGEVKTFWDFIFGIADKVPILNLFTPILRVMTFQYTDQIPSSVSLLLDLMAVITIFVVYGLFKYG